MGQRLEGRMYLCLLSHTSMHWMCCHRLGRLEMVVLIMVSEPSKKILRTGRTSFRMPAHRFGCSRPLPSISSRTTFSERRIQPKAHMNDNKGRYFYVHTDTKTTCFHEWNDFGYKYRVWGILSRCKSPPTPRTQKERHRPVLYVWTCVILILFIWKKARVFSRQFAFPTKILTL